MPIFEPSRHPHHWTPSALAAGPFAGLQGGAVASLLTAEIEAQAGSRQMGHGDFGLGLVPATDADDGIANPISVVSEGGRVSVVDNTLWPAGEDQPCATVRVTLSRQRSVEIPGFADPSATLPIRSGSRSAPGARRMASHGSWRRWRLARATASPGSGSTMPSSTAPDACRCRRCWARRTGPTASRGRSRTRWPTRTRT